MYGIAINPCADPVPRWRTGGDVDSYLDCPDRSWPDLLVDLVGFVVSAIARAFRANHPIYRRPDLRIDPDLSSFAAPKHKVAVC